MGKTSLQIVTEFVAKKHNLTIKEADKFLSAFFETIQQGLKEDKIVKIKGLGTFKIQSVKARESINVNTGERVVIERHEKVSFTPDAYMKAMVNKPFSDFETVVLNDGVQFEEVSSLDEEDKEFMQSSDDSSEGLSKIDALHQQKSTEDNGNETMPLSDGKIEVSSDKKVDIPIHPFEDKENDNSDLIHITDSNTKENSATDQQEEVPDTANIPYDNNTKEVINNKSNSPKNNLHLKECDIIKDEVQDEASTVSSNNMGVSNVNYNVDSEETGSDDDIFDTSHDISPKHRHKAWITILTAIFLAGVIFGIYTLGKHADASKQQLTSTSKHKVVVKPNTPKNDIVKEDNSIDTLKDKTTKNSDYKLLSSNPKIRYGAYDIVGVEKEVVLKKGENMSSYSKKTLGPDMVGYFQVLNNAETMEEGDTMKVPKVELRPEYRKKR
ncbi:UNVERIFIED_CONTAM: HU family DNA-binding protein [Prevotella sp. 15_C9]